MCITAMINHVDHVSPRLKLIIFHTFTFILAICGYITNSHSDQQLRVSLLVQLAEDCTGIEKATGSNPVQD